MNYIEGVRGCLRLLSFFGGITKFSEIEFAHPVLAASIASDYGINFKALWISVFVHIVRLVQRDEHPTVEFDSESCQIVSRATADQGREDSFVDTAFVGSIAFELVEIVVDTNTTHVCESDLITQRVAWPSPPLTKGATLNDD